MDAFLNWFFAFITKMFSGIWTGISGFFTGIIKLFDFGTYFALFEQYQADFGTVGWVLAVISFLLVYVFWGFLIFLIVLGIRKLFNFRSKNVKNEELLEEISNLHVDLDRAVKEKQRILEMKFGEDIPSNFTMEEIGTGAISAPSQVQAENLPEEIEQHSESRFFRLSMIDEKYVSYQHPGYDNTLTLSEICDDLRNFACFNSHLYYDIKTIRLMIAGLATTKLVLLQGISGTGKTSLPYVMGKYFENDTTIASVQPSWKDRAELFGFFNEFTKKFNETEVLCRIYEASFSDDVNIIVLDELNIARVEYYFAEMLSVLELPDKNTWRIQLVNSIWNNDPAHLEDGKLIIPENVWYVGTANNDDSTFSVSDKVYDRAFTINLNNKGIPFDAPETKPRRIAYSYIDKLYDEAVEADPVSNEIIHKIELLDNYVIEKFKVAFGNRIMKQFKTFVPVFKACGGEENDAIDYVLVTKVFRKFESLNLALIRDEINGLVNQLDTIFGKDAMKESIAFLLRLKKSY